MDYHLHSTFSPDARNHPEEVINKAIELGLREICFTDHMDYEDPAMPPGERVFEFDPEEYFTVLGKLQSAYADRISVKIGVEMGLQIHTLERSNETLEKYPFHFRLGAVHSVKRTDMTSPESKEWSSKEMWHNYFTDMYEVVKGVSRIDSLAHFDMPLRYNEAWRDKVLPYDRDLVAAILELMVKRNIALEINLAGLRFGLPTPNPAPEFVKLYQQCGGNLFTFGSDAHNLGTMMDPGPLGLQYLRECGVDYPNIWEKQE